MEYGSPDLIHLVAEGVKLAFADREAWYGDGFDTPIETMLGDDYNRDRRALIGRWPAASCGRDHRTGGHRSFPSTCCVGRFPAAPGTGEPSDRYIKAKADGDTCHFDIVDRWGNVGSGTPSGGWLHSNPVIPSLGFPLGTRLQMTWLQEGYPTSLTPGRRPRTALSPGLAFRDGAPAMAFGVPGGDAQDQWAYNFFLGVAVGGLSLQEAADAPQWRTMSFPNSFYPRASQPASLFLEDRHDPAVVGELRRRGHEVSVVARGRSAGFRLSPAIRRPVCSARAPARGRCGRTPSAADRKPAGDRTHR